MGNAGFISSTVVPFCPCSLIKKQDKRYSHYEGATGEPSKAFRFRGLGVYGLGSGIPVFIVDGCPPFAFLKT